MLSPEAITKIDYELTKYPANQRQAAVMSALRIVQTERGWLSKESITEVAQYLGMPEIAALEVATFYNMYDLSPVGKYKITVCTNISCMLRDSDVIVDHLKAKLGVGFNEVTADGKFCIKEGECMGCCGGAPLLHVNNTQMHEFLTTEKVDAVLKDLLQQSSDEEAVK
ncbi:NADH-quinone oxidoreductase subunit NuoE [Methylotenera sp.]|uniref:NADH-quinone oxidoreductase subunit NuoE n=1 Tax=Methylotenera sp. TaxID=2051956 RepID=UPI00272684ED|nr:NADH-quinone oxidoreductase subunit NuoE [Methylotenera sp.]MDO9206524.1 NADH-quinone oxidoreductase subunit NuoE [Methylotenera sp.]MDO9393487.1 NADH-quinone oxidoreductase subunit NuoE [Methylotenera sp.]MDP2072289.1 NADH-quinone oxidoreductase subunit NuoE [Methylotenera sp.]MDP2231056.1 NADH-quinone oxidoreductase subunit NuoE [Methylotenera sp.]MDP3005088.1 NADH-quinone oxidoreductase subunit NuoE [Methylotenera sp.]